jgi:protein CpxP
LTFLCEFKETTGRLAGLVSCGASGFAARNDDQESLEAWMRKERIFRAGKAGRKSTVALGAFLGVFLAWGTASAFQNAGAQGQRPGKRSPEEMMNRRMDMLSKKLNLSDDQKAKVKPLLENELKQVQELRQDTSLSRQQKRTKFMDLRASTNSQIRALLNADQQKKFDEMQEQMKQRRGKWHKHGGSSAPPPSDNP